ncbi:MAG TPA: phosphoenolpyruvate carboxykinase domain-containing protein, partial [Candidatus Paceibacterota bacterium]|nr:phosphoenolpyruvate carboxykinase domain-containing protein [Candidatus Paceibacterota bacterium]
GQQGVVRRDPFAMLPFCGYNMGDYFAHWLSFAQKTDRSKLPKVFFVNWFRRSADGKFLWPGYGENSRVLKWICERVEGTAKAQTTPIGNIPTRDALDLSGLGMHDEDINQLLSVDLAGWKKEIDDVAVNYAKFGDKLPKALNEQLDNLRKRIG